MMTSDSSDEEPVEIGLSESKQRAASEFRAQRESVRLQSEAIKLKRQKEIERNVRQKLEKQAVGHRSDDFIPFASNDAERDDKTGDPHERSECKNRRKSNKLRRKSGGEEKKTRRKTLETETTQYEVISLKDTELNKTALKRTDETEKRKNYLNLNFKDRMLYDKRRVKRAHTGQIQAFALKSFS